MSGLTARRAILPACRDRVEGEGEVSGNGTKREPPPAGRLFNHIFFGFMEVIFIAFDMCI